MRPESKQTSGAKNREPIPFDDALRRLVNTPPRHKIKRPKDWPQDEDPGDPNDPRCPAL